MSDGVRESWFVRWTGADGSVKWWHKNSGWTTDRDQASQQTVERSGWSLLDSCRSKAPSARKSIRLVKLTRRPPGPQVSSQAIAEAVTWWQKRATEAEGKLAEESASWTSEVRRLEAERDLRVDQRDGAERELAEAISRINAYVAEVAALKAEVERLADGATGGGRQ
jgi:uncharacterized small protein (DUF1192 family)